MAELLAVASSFPHRLTSRLHSKSNLIATLHCCSEQEATAHAADRCGQADLCKNASRWFCLYLSRDKTCHKQYTIYMLPQESSGKTPNVHRGVIRPSQFYFWEVSRARLQWVVVVCLARPFPLYNYIVHTLYREVVLFSEMLFWYEIFPLLSLQVSYTL